MTGRLEDPGETFYMTKPIRSKLPEMIEKFECVPIAAPHPRDLLYTAPTEIDMTSSNVGSYIFNKRVTDILQNINHDIIHINSDPRFGHFISQVYPPATIKMNGCAGGISQRRTRDVSTHFH